MIYQRDPILEPINVGTSEYPEYKTLATYSFHTAECGLCGKMEPINEIGEFKYPCPRRIKSE